MRRAIISDIHGNHVALEAVLADIQKRKVDDIVCLGDICGYGPEPAECVDTVRDKCAWTLMGNHDWALFQPTIVGFGKSAKAAIEWHREALTPSWYSFADKKKRWDWLQSLEPSKFQDGIRYVHASPRDPLMEYVLEELFNGQNPKELKQGQEILETLQGVCFCGHSHRPGYISPGEQWRNQRDMGPEPLLYTLDKKLLVNIGSVGQPRDNNPDSCYVVLDTAENTITFHRVPYDIKEAQARFEKAPSADEHLIKRLETGK